MTDQASEINNAADPGQLVAGQMLAQQRESLSLSIEECAETLKLSVSKIQALESGDSKPFASEIFIRGYLKSYAKLLRLSEEELIDCYHSQSSSSRSVHPLEATEKADSSKWWLPYVVGIIIISLWFVLSSCQSFKLTGDTDKPLEQATKESASNQLVLPINGVDNDGENTENSDVLESELGALPAGEAAGDQASIESQEQEVKQTLIDGIESSSEENTELGQFEQSAASLEGDAGVEVESTLEESSTVVSSVEESIGDQGENSTVVSNASANNGESLGGDTLFFTFTEDCWVEVVDASEAIVFSDLRKANTELTVQGNAPFSVIVGNISGTTLSLNGKLVKLSNSRNGRTLRLTLNPNS